MYPCVVSVAAVGLPAVCTTRLWLAAQLADRFTLQRVAPGLCAIYTRRQAVNR